MKHDTFKRFAPDLAAAALLLLLPVLVFWQVWTPNSHDRVMFGGDILMGAYPTRVFVHRLFMLGQAPAWNPYQLAGMPLFGDVQVAPYYLPNLLLDVLFGGRDLPYTAFEMLVVAHYALGALLFYAYVRGLGVRPAAALIGAIGFEFNGFFVGHRGHYNMLAVVVWLPGVLWLLDMAWRAARPRAALGWAVAAGLALSQLVMAGHPQAALYCSLTIAAYMLYRWHGTLRRATSWAGRLRVPALFALAGVLAAGIAAVALLPAAELLGRSLRNDLSYDFAAQYSLLPRNFVGLLMPEFLGWSATEFRIYSGILTLVLAAVALVVPERPRPERRFLGLAALVALVTALGGFTVLHGLIYRFVPGFSSIRVSVRAFYIANFALAALAAWNRLPRLWSAFKSPKTLLALTASALLIAVNWGLFIWAVTADRIIDTSLGYYINPLVSFVLGVVWLGERLTKVQLIAIGLAVLGVVNQTIAVGYLPWVSLALAVSFGIYGLIRKTVPVESLEGLTVEAFILAPISLGYIVWLATSGSGAFLHQGIRLDLLLVLAGPLTAVPLLLFAAGARLVRLSTMGFLQYLAPSISLLIAVFVYHEPFTHAHAITFALIWSALALVSWEALSRERYSAA